LYWKISLKYINIKLVFFGGIMIANQFCEVVTMIDSPDKAGALADQILESRIASCAQISGPIESKYWWKQELVTASEWKITFKTQTVLSDKLVQLIKNLHSYEIPEIIIILIRAGDREYLKWIESETKTVPSSQLPGRKEKTNN
jgi:periplasmic divalent cation tolerance protein